MTRSVTVVLKQLESLDLLLDGAVQAGANRDFDIELTSSRADELKPEATAQALADARAQANAAAEQLGVKVVSVRSIDLEGASRQGTVTASAASSTASPTKAFPTFALSLQSVLFGGSCFLVDAYLLCAHLQSVAICGST